MTERLRVLQVIKTLDIGGAERFGLELARTLDPQRFALEVCAFFWSDTEMERHWAQQLGAQGIAVWHAAPWQGNNRFGNYLRGLAAMRRHLKAAPVDIFHSHFQLGTLAGLELRARGAARRVVRTAHNHNRREWEPGLYGALRYQVFSRWAYPLLLDAEVGVSQAITTELQRQPGARFARRPAQVIYNALAADLNDPLPEFIWPAPGARRVVGSVGRLTEQKGYAYLLEAIPLAAAALPQVEFWLIGDGDQRQALEAQASRLGLGPRLRFLGRQTHIPHWLRQMDLFVLPSVWEGLPTVLMESMACGVPVLATDIPGTRELVQPGQTGWLVPPRDPQALAQAIVTALTRPQECADLRQRAYASLEPFRMPAVAQQYAALYEELCR